MVLRNQLLRWKEFRQWQRFNRGDLEAWGKPTTPIELELAYDNFTRYRRKFSNYTAAVRCLLQSYDCIQNHAFTFCDTGLQDRLTTWIEYLGYEHWHLYQPKEVQYEVRTKNSLLQWIADQVPRIQSELPSVSQRQQDYQEVRLHEDQIPTLESASKRRRAKRFKARAWPPDQGTEQLRTSRNIRRRSPKGAHPLRRSARLAQRAVRSSDKVS